MGTCGGEAVELSHVILNAVAWGASGPSTLEVVGNKLWIGIAVALGVGLVIFVHELGHFLAAKLFGVKVEKFYVGFDVPINLFGIRLPRHFGKFRWGETEYGIGVIPLGGYVKMLGQDDDPRQAAAERERIRLEAAEGSDAELSGEQADAAPLLDPRSYPAKSVWQRMVIISAGVVMNLITSVLFGAAAFLWGVNYTPAVVGSTVAGYPAWQSGVQPGGRVISAGRIEDDPKLHFKAMQLEIIRTYMEDRDSPVRLELAYADEVREYPLKPEPVSGEDSLPMVGVGMPQANEFARYPALSPHMVVAEAFGDRVGGGRIVAIDGQSIPVDPVVGKRLAAPVMQRLAAAPTAPVELTIALPGDDGAASEEKFTLPPQPYKSIGVKLSVGPVAALARGGPAAEAGIEVGDQLMAISGVEGPLDWESLPETIAALEGPLQLRLRRGSGEAAEELEITVPHQPQPLSRNPVERVSGQIELESLGMTVEPGLEIVGFYPGAGELDASGEMRAGDRLQKVTVRWPEKERPAELADFFEKLSGSKLPLEQLEEGQRIGTDYPLTALVRDLQHLPVGTRLDLAVEKADTGKIVEVGTSLAATDRFWYERGFYLQTVQLKHFAESTGEAFALGYREAERKAGEVFSFLGLLFTGRLSPRNLGGPAMIATVAGSEASAGLARLLLFLTFLSVNLAILNFLPIPALDGGHMVFLIAEAVRGKPVDEELQARLTMAGVLALLCLMCFVIVNDVINLTGRG
jgi:regulator of sigma E protease